MTALEHLHYAVGQVAYAMAGIDGKVQKEERRKFHDLVAAELRCRHYAFDISEIIFTILDRDKTDPETAYTWAMNEIRMNSHYLSPGLKSKFIRVADKIRKAFPPVTEEEKTLFERFRKDLAPLNGDPVYCD